MNPLKQLESRDDVYLLVSHFYDQVRKDDLLGPIFDRHIAEDRWPYHLDKLTDFWETNLFGIPRYKGSPTAKHLAVDMGLNFSIEQKHFGRWLQLWFQTIDRFFEGQKAIQAKESARKMAHGQFMSIWNARNMPASNRSILD